MHERTKKNALIVGAIVLALLSMGAGALIALSDDEQRAQTPGPSPTTTPAQTSGPSETPEPTEMPEPSGSQARSLEDAPSRAVGSRGSSSSTFREVLGRRTFRGRRRGPARP
jgi:hypothetical protein